MNYTEKLRRGAKDGRGIICMGIDPVPGFMPYESGGAGEKIVSFFAKIFESLAAEGISPGAFKPNQGFFSCLDKPREGTFEGSAALAKILDMLSAMFPGVPVILDYKRGDIARSSKNYALEGFESWKADALTVSAYMGRDSVEPFFKEAAFRDAGVYVLNRTSNQGAGEFQNIRMEDGRPLYLAVAENIRAWADRYPGTGAVVGATSPQELGEIAGIFKDNHIPLLIPGVGSQGGNVKDVLNILKQQGYDIPVIRINVSSAISYPWVRDKKSIPGDWVRECTDSFKRFAEETGGVL